MVQMASPSATFILESVVHGHHILQAGRWHVYRWPKILTETHGSLVNDQQ